jgi:hypothetical protein
MVAENLLAGGSRPPKQPWARRDIIAFIGIPTGDTGANDRMNFPGCAVMAR